MEYPEYTFMNKTLGKLKLVDAWGTDAKIIECARVSYCKGRRKRNPNDSLFIENLLRYGHETPFEHCGFTFYVECPIFVWRQWIRHRLASTNELSARYSRLDGDFYVPDAERIGKTTLEKDREPAIQAYVESCKNAFAAYEKMLELGVVKEVARSALPVGAITAVYWTCNLREFFHFIKLRIAKTAQYEIRLFATAALDSVKNVFPITFDRFLALNSEIAEDYEELKVKLVHKE